MNKKITMSLCALFITSMLGAANGMKSMTFSQETHSVKAGALIEVDANFECDPGYVLAGWGSDVLFKHATPEFFAKPEVQVKKPFKNTRDYDSIMIAKYLHFTKAMNKGSFPVRIDTTGMPAGDYAVTVTGRFMKDGKSYYAGKNIYITVTEGDNKKFATTPQHMPASLLPPPDYSWAKKITVTGVPDTPVTAGTKLALNCDFVANNGEAFGGRTVSVLRKNAPRAYFDRTDITIKKYPASSDYDSSILVPYHHSQPLAGSNFNFTLDTSKFTPGKYVIFIQFRIVKGAGKADGYPVYEFPLKIQ